jgi:hypothetical protein
VVALAALALHEDAEVGVVAELVYGLLAAAQGAVDETRDG